MSDRKGLITVAELAARLEGEPAGLAIVDIREKPDEGGGTIPGAVWVDLHDGFAQRRPERQLNYDLPRPDEVAATLGRLGIGPATEVVFADDMGNRWATRAYWMLHYYRHAAPVHVLDGGLAKWRELGMPTVAGFASPEPVDYPAPTATDPSIRATAEDLRDGVAAGTIQACDVRTPEEYSGEVALSGRGGHVPGAPHVFWEEADAPDRTFLPDDRLREVLAPFLSGGRELVTYCQGGIRASHTWFCLHELLGLPARLYAASWEEWGPREDLPVDNLSSSQTG